MKWLWVKASTEEPKENTVINNYINLEAFMPPVGAWLTIATREVEQSKWQFPYGSTVYDYLSLAVDSVNLKDTLLTKKQVRLSTK